MYVRKEAVLSSQIEGAQSSLQELLAAEAELFDQPQCGRTTASPAWCNPLLRGPFKHCAMRTS